jgi:integrase
MLFMYMCRGEWWGNWEKRGSGLTYRPSTGGDIMPRQKRFKTNYPGVYYIEVGPPSKTEKVYYITYRKDGKKVEEKAGRQHSDDMTPARASGVRADRMRGKAPTNKEQREAKKAEIAKWTVDKLWDEYKRQKKAEVKCIVTDEYRYKKHIGPAFGKEEPREIGPLDVERLKRDMKKGNAQVADATVRNVLEVLRRIVNFGVNMQLCPPMSFKIKMPKVNNERTEDLTPDELSNLLKALEQDKDILAANFMRMALYTGMRRGELFKLKWEHIDFERGFISIVDPKGGKDQKIPLNDMARQVLESHLKIEGCSYVFPGRFPDRPRTNIKGPVHRIRKAAGLHKDFRPLHGLRHTYASMLASSGQVDMYTLQKLLTHKSPQMTMRYAHLRDETLKRASNVASELFREASPAG